MKESYYVRADIFNIQLITDCSKVFQYIEEKIFDFKRLTINFEILSHDINPDVKLIYKDCFEYNISYENEKKEFVFKCPWNEIDRSTVLPMIFRYIVELLRQKRGEIKLHASAVEKDGIVSLFLAPSEGGKTSTALSMCQNYGCSLKANDASVIEIVNEIPMMLRGDTEFKVRYNGLEAYSKKIFREKVEEKKFTNTPWYSKMRIAANDVGVEINNDVLPVKYVFFVKIDSLVKEISINKYNNNFFEREKYWFKPKMQIIQNIGGTIRGNDLIPLGNNGEILPLNIPSLDTFELCIERTKFVNKLFNTCDVYQIRGQLNDITNTISEIIYKNKEKE